MAEEVGAGVADLGLTASDGTGRSVGPHHHYQNKIDSLYTTEPELEEDALVTPTSVLQQATVEKCLPLLAPKQRGPLDRPNGIPRLHRQRHITFLKRQLGKLGAKWVALDASRPWMFYWTLHSMALLGADVSAYGDGLIATARYMQNDTGGFGGGFGQRSHLATTYAMVLALAIVGGPEAYEVIDRRAMWKWLSSLKQASGAFQMSQGGEVDVRGAYCAAVIISLLNLPLDLPSSSPARASDQARDLFTGLGEYVQRCKSPVAPLSDAADVTGQTFEGGIAGKPDAEAHGAYTFCALGCLSILGAPHLTVRRFLDVPRLISWLSSRQYAPEGGFSGRTNKLVDGCYSHWVGSSWPLIQASMGPSQPSPSSGSETATTGSSGPDAHCFFDREGLIRFIMSCGQDLEGGMRDKPDKPPDAYHTCYVLNGLSSAQHRVASSCSTTTATTTTTSFSPSSCCSAAPDTAGSAAAMADVTWTVSAHVDPDLIDEADRLNPADPVYAILPDRREAMMTYFRSKPGF